MKLFASSFLTLCTVLSFAVPQQAYSQDFDFSVTSEEGESEVPQTKEELKKFIDSLGTSEDAVGGTVNEESTWQEIYDIYSRQIAYREKTKEYRKSILERQKSFAEPADALKEKYKENMDTVYEAESKIYQDEMSGDSDDAMSMIDRKAPKMPSRPERPVPPSRSISGGEDVDARTQGEKPDLKEIDVPVPSADGANRKVYTDENAPEFDPSRL